MTRTPLPPEVVEALGQFDSPTISNAIEHFEVRNPVTGYASMELRCQFPDLKPMVGYAVTCTSDTTTPWEKRPMNFDNLLDAVQAAPKPAVLVTKYIGPDRLRSAFLGDMSCTTLQKLGVVGAVTDGGNRDKSGIRRRAPGFQIFSPGWVVSHGYGVLFDFGVTVSVCGLTIEPGDLLHGDENGLLKVPLDIAESVVEQARLVQEAEREYFDFLQSTSYTFEELKRRI